MESRQDAGDARRKAGMRRLGAVGCAFAIVMQMAGHAEAQTVNRCVVNGKVVYQDEACAPQADTVGQDLERAKRNEILHRKLDRLQAQGYGMLQKQPPPLPEAPPPAAGGEHFVPQSRSWAAREARAARISAELQERTERKNAASAAALTRILDETSKACAGKLPDYPVVGMSDETFRKCTLHARFGGATQVVVSEYGNVPLRLYVFPTEQAHKVYSVGGVITAIKP